MSVHEVYIYDADHERVVSVTVGELRGLCTDERDYGVSDEDDSDISIPERTCTMTEYISGEQADYDCDDTMFHCSRCDHEYAVYEQNEDGDTYAMMPRYCPHCGARVVDE